MDYATADVVVDALHAAIDAGQIGYPPLELGGELGRAYAARAAGITRREAHNAGSSWPPARRPRSASEADRRTARAMRPPAGPPVS